MCACSTPEKANDWSQKRHWKEPLVPLPALLPAFLPPLSATSSCERAVCAAGGESERAIWASPMHSASCPPPAGAEEEEEEEDDEEGGGVLKSEGVGGGRLGLMQPSEACWELWSGGGVPAVRLERGVKGGLGFSGGIDL